MLSTNSYMSRHQNANLKKFNNKKLKISMSLIFNFKDESDGD